MSHSEVFSRRVLLPVSAAEAFAWHALPGALVALTPPWERIRLVSMTDGIRNGSRVTVRAKVGPVWTTWVMEHFGYAEGREFNDRMLRGPFPLWEHRHLFEDDQEGTCWMSDTIRFRLPFGIFGRILGAAFTRRKLERMFAYRHAVTEAALSARAS
jgi:ligand-binding SRPBCC domain-containing protein